MSDVTASRSASFGVPEAAADKVEGEVGDLGLGDRRDQSSIDLGVEGVSDVRALTQTTTTQTTTTQTITTQRFRAFEAQLNRTVVINVCTAAPGSDAAARFASERSIMAQLSGHSGIVPLLGFGSTADGRPYQITPFYPRGSMADLIADHGPMAWREATVLLEPLAITLAEIHSCGALHGKVMPTSVLLTDFSVPRLSDFSDHCPVEAADDKTADVYGLAQVLWSMLAGRQAGAKAATIDPTGHTPEPIADLLRRALSPDPEQRPANAAAFLTELRRSVGQAEANVPPAINAATDGTATDITTTKGTVSTVGANTPNDAPSQRLEKLYILLLVAMISAGVLTMVAAAILTVN